MQEIIQSAPGEKKDLQKILKILEENGGTLSLGGEIFAIPESLRKAMMAATYQLSRDKFIAIVARNKELSTQEVADLLDVSRPHVVKLLEEGSIPFIRIGTHRRVLLEDALVYQKKLQQERQERLSELTHLAQDLGMYDKE